MDKPLTFLSRKNSSKILLTALVNVADNDNTPIIGRILLDTGAETNFITNNFLERLKLKKVKHSIPVGGLNQITTFTKYEATILIQSSDGKYQQRLKCLSIPSISEFVPTKPIPKDIINIPKGIRLADPQFNLPRPIDILFGIGPTLSLLCVGKVKLSKPGEPELYLQKTLLGWVIGGNINACSIESTNTVLHTQLQHQLVKFWEIEECPISKHLSPEEVAAEAHYQQHQKRDLTGRYIVALPFTDKKHKLGESKETAMKRYLNLERRFERDPIIYEEYCKVINEYLSLGHMSKVVDKPSEGYYLPHHPVLKETSMTTKLRVVFDGSAKTSSSLSLNETLLVGPTIQDDIFSLIIRFRCYRYVFSGDIEKMYRQFLVRDEDRKYQKILWRDESGNIQTYQLNTVTFGLSAAPFLAIRSLHQLARDCINQFPEAARILTEDMYVDDLLSGADTIEEALAAQQEVISCLKQGCLHIRQWASNDMQLLQHIPAENINQKLYIDDNKTLKTLGVYWNSKHDSLNYQITSQNVNKPVTKRKILSDIASIFDPLGLLGPVILVAKHTIQQLWAAGVDWDESVPTHIHTQWSNLYKQLPLLSHISIPRNVFINNNIKIELHGFADASNVGYGACIYIRSITLSNEIQTHLLCSKSRVAPLKTINTPRLELCAAQTLVQLYTSVIRAFKRKISRVVLWSDSTITLYWIKTSPHLLKTFVANRVAEIQKGSVDCEWHHVGSADNPADKLSRGQMPESFVNDNRLWFNGPEWLNKPESDWPNKELSTYITTEEFKTCLKSTILDNITERFSCIHKLDRVIAYCLRFAKNARKALQLKCKSVTAKRCEGFFVNVEEKKQARITIIKLIQQQLSLENLKSRKGSAQPSKFRLAQLSPFLDENGLWRVGGRLQNSNLTYDQKHPIILPKNNHVTNLIITEAHISHLHAGAQTTLYAIRQQYWPLDGKNQIKNIIHKCHMCFRAKPPQVNYVMGNLPSSRVVNPSVGFQQIGVDYCGPFFIKERKHQNRKMTKAYVSVFICMASKAVHMELVSDLTSAGFLGALRRFISRRGKPTTIYSDNGTNFVGANKELREILDDLQTPTSRKKICNHLRDQGIEWKFSPPLSPHFGGLWEAAVKSFKHHLMRIVGNLHFTFEEFNTIIIEIEAVLNSRPLAPCSNDPNDLLPITPADLVVGRPLLPLPERDLTSTPSNRLPNWALTQKVRQDLWKRWQHDYLNQLHVRNKWNHGDHNLKKDSLVLLRDDNMPSMQWRLGRITELFPGHDGVVRVVNVKTSNGIIKRNVRKLAPLPVDVDPLI